MESDKKSLLTIIHRSYEEILGLEMDYAIQFSAEDFRPRIEYFHDAVRAYTAGETPYGDAYSRLSIEQLTYDMEMLRYIQAHPAPTSGHRHDNISSSGHMGQSVHAGGSNLPMVMNGQQRAQPQRIDRNTRMRLADLYKSYTVIFAAMLVETADKNYNSRIEDMNAEVTDMASLEQLIKKLMQSQEASSAIVEEQIEDLAHQLENEELREKIMQFLHEKKQKQRLAEESTRKLRENMKEVDKQIAMVEACHTRFSHSRLMVYQESLDVVKGLAQQGLNIAGKFIGNAASKDMGQGTSRGR